VSRAKANQAKPNRANCKIHSTFDYQLERQPGVLGEDDDLKANLVIFFGIWFGQHPVMALTAAALDRVRFASSRSAFIAESRVWHRLRRISCCRLLRQHSTVTPALVPVLSAFALLRYVENWVTSEYCNVGNNSYGS
jgi:hypothetical protein